MKIVLLSETDSIINNLVMELRNADIQNDQMRFTANIEKLGIILGYEASKYLSFSDYSFNTPYHDCHTQIIKGNPVLYTILRAGIALQRGLQNIFPSSSCAYIAAKHVHSEHPELKYIDAPQIDNQAVILSDPIIATGKNISFAIDSIKRFGKPSRIVILSVISSAPAIEYLSQILPEHTVFITCQVDSFIPGVRGTDPGVGDMGDLLYGKRVKIEY